MRNGVNRRHQQETKMYALAEEMSQGHTLPAQQVCTLFNLKGSAHQTRERRGETHTYVKHHQYFPPTVTLSLSSEQGGTATTRSLSPQRTTARGEPCYVLLLLPAFCAEVDQSVKGLRKMIIKAQM